jgi:hypothetical protein
MTALLIADTVLLAVVVFLVGGLLRSHAEILRKLDQKGGAAEKETIDPRIPAPDEAGGEGAEPAPDLQGVTPDGDFVRVGMRPGERPVLLAFLTGGCATCEGFWRALGDPANTLPGDARAIVVTKDPSHESRSRLRKLINGPIEVVMSSSAWEDYRVPSSPYFVFIGGGTAEIQGVGSSASWEQLESLISDALEDVALAEEDLPRRNNRPDRRSSLRAERARDREQRINEELSRSGIDEGHPSLYAGAHENAPREKPTQGGNVG